MINGSEQISLGKKSKKQSQQSRVKFSQTEPDGIWTSKLLIGSFQSGIMKNELLRDGKNNPFSKKPSPARERGNQFTGVSALPFGASDKRQRQG